MRTRKQTVLAMLLAALMLFSVTALAAEESENPFQDVKAGEWYYDAVQYVRKHGIFAGTSSTVFDPEGTMTRGMFVAVLGRMAGVDTASYMGEMTFSDVPVDKYYAPYVAWAAKNGITQGTEEGLFSPNEQITRQQMITLFARYFENFDVSYETGKEVTTLPTDMDRVADYAKEAVTKMWQAGLINGDGGKVTPGGKASRAQAAALCMRIDQAVETWKPEPDGIVTYDLWIGNVQVTAENQTDVLGNGTVVYKGDNNMGTLILSDADIRIGGDGAGYLTAGINSLIDRLTVRLVGENQVGSGEYIPDNGILADSLTITGEGSLTVCGAMAGVAANTISVESGTIDASTAAAENGMVSIGLWAYEDLSVSGGTVSGWADMLPDGHCCGIHAGGSIELGGKPVIRAGKSDRNTRRISNVPAYDYQDSYIRIRVG